MEREEPPPDEDGEVEIPPELRDPLFEKESIAGDFLFEIEFKVQITGDGLPTKPDATTEGGQE